MGRARAHRARSGRRRAARRSIGAATRTARAPRGHRPRADRPRRSPRASRSATAPLPRSGRRRPPERRPRRRPPVRARRPEGGGRQRAGLVDADRVHGGERLDRVQLLRERPEPGHAEGGRGIRDRDEQDQALGDQRHHPCDRRVDRVREGDVLLLERDDQHRAQRDHHREEHVEKPVDRPLERRPRVPELARRPGDPPRVAVRPDRGHLERARALEHEGARPHLLADRALHGSGLAGEDRLVEPEPARLRERAVGHDLVPRSEPHEVADDEVRDVHRSGLSVAHDGRARCDERGEPVELVAGAKLLPDPDPGVGDEDAEEERVTPVAEEQCQDPQCEQDRVERRDRVGADDRRRRPACRRLCRRRPRGPARRSLRLAQALAHGDDR